MQKNEKYNKHMTYDDRIEIQECLNKGMTFKAIGKRIGKDKTTVSREVKRHLHAHTNSFVKTDEVCPKLLKAPYVCNGCEKRTRSSCMYRRQVYTAKPAQEEYRTLLTEARSGVFLNKESFYETESIISEAVRNGQHIYHAATTNKVPVSISSIYRYINNGYYSIKPIDLPRSVKFKIRHSSKNDFVPKWAKQGRTYADFLDYIEQHPDMPLTQIDTVIGRIGGKVIMTIHFVICNFMIGLLLENKTAVEAADKIKQLKHTLREHGFNFGDIVPLILTDNGGEFSNVAAFENDIDGNLESHLFFCEPRAPFEKPHIEKNHTLFRDIVPSGSSFDNFTQETVNLIFSHVNSVKRQQFNGKSPYELFSFYYSQELASALGISFINPTEVIQSPKLLH